ncbi:MAG: hypothetical protein QOD77_2079 [Thermoplasmata archaeon]|nr:hypothetical protein [Thermoplasmata archaeon]
MQAAHAVAALLFGVTFLLLALGRLGKTPLRRGPVALAGGALSWLVLAANGDVPWTAWTLVDPQILLLLAGLMLLAGLAEAGGVLGGLRRRLLGLPGPLLLWLCVAGTAVASALVLNDAAVVVLVPFLVPLFLARGLPPVPAVSLLAVAANLGSLLTPFGNPQNAVLAADANLGVLEFLRVQGPWVALGLALLAAPCWLAARRAHAPAAAPEPVQAKGRPWLLLCLAVFLALACWPGGPGLGWAAAAAGLAAYAGMRVVLGRAADRAAARSIDLNVLLLFVGLYLLTAGLPRWLPVPDLAWLEGPWSAAGATVLLSNTAGNVPAMLAFRALDPSWTAAHAHFLVFVSTLGGALLLSGSAASLLAADQARRAGVEVRFLPFARTAVWILPLLLLGLHPLWSAG